MDAAEAADSDSGGDPSRPFEFWFSARDGFLPANDCGPEVVQLTDRGLVHEHWSGPLVVELRENGELPRDERREQPPSIDALSDLSFPFDDRQQRPTERADQSEAQVSLRSERATADIEPSGAAVVHLYSLEPLPLHSQNQLSDLPTVLPKPGIDSIEQMASTTAFKANIVAVESEIGIALTPSFSGEGAAGELPFWLSAFETGFDVEALAVSGSFGAFEFAMPDVGTEPSNVIARHQGLFADRVAAATLEADELLVVSQYFAASLLLDEIVAVF